MILAVSQNRFVAPQRIQRNNQAQTFGLSELYFECALALGALAIIG